MLGFLAALTLGFTQPSTNSGLSDIGRSMPVGSCRLATPEQCAGSGEWISDDPKFKTAIISFFQGVPKGKLGHRNEAAWELFMVTINGPHVDPDRIAPGIYLFSACLMHHCPGREVAILVGRGRVLAAAIVGDVCDRCKPSMYVFVKKSETSSRRWINALARWGGYGSQSYVVFLP